MGLTPYLGIERGNIACHKSEARFGTLLREGRLASRAFRDEAFWQSQVNFRPPNPTIDEKALWSKGKRVRCHTPCLPKMPRGRARRSRATTWERIPYRQGDRRRPSQGASRPTGNTGETWEGNPIGSQRIYMGGRDLFSATEKKWSRFDSALPNDTSNTNDLCLECWQPHNQNQRGWVKGRFGTKPEWICRKAEPPEVWRLVLCRHFRFPTDFGTSEIGLITQILNQLVDQQQRGPILVFNVKLGLGKATGSLLNSSTGANLPGFLCSVAILVVTSWTIRWVHFNIKVMSVRLDIEN
ncbi:hypothetical protein ACS0TY_003026 [Phlomoides rotata]